MRTVKPLTGVVSSSVRVRSFSASADASDNPPEGCMVGGAMHGTSGGARVDGPASAFVCSSK